jgi:HemY protein
VSRTVALLLLVTALAAAAAYYLRAETGYVLVAWRHWILETSLLGFLGSVAVALLLGYYGVKLLFALLRLPATIQGALTQRREKRAQESFEAGLLKLLEGRWTAAEIDLVRRAADHPAPGLNYLLAARAAQRAGATARRDQYLAQAAAQGDGPVLATQLLRAELQFEQDASSAVPLLQELRQQDPTHAYVIELLARAYARSGAWEPLRLLLSSPAAARALAPDRYRALHGRALSEALGAAGASARLDALKALWESAPAEMRSVAAVRRAYASALARLGADAEAGAQIGQMLKAEWDPVLVRAYGELAGLDPVTQLATVEGWLTQQGEKPELLLAAGQVCTRNQLWGKARAYLDGALRLQPTPEAFLALAQLCEKARQPEDAALFYRRGLELAAGNGGQTTISPKAPTNV